jgi:PAS domain S-box-containing protein
MIATRAPLGETLRTLALMIETRAEGLVASILLLGPDKKHLHLGAAPSLPDEFNRSAEGLAIGPNVGSCGTAAYLDEPVIVTDIATDPRWATARDLALSFGLRACWSTPIHSSRGDVLGTFAMYYRESRAPDAWHRKLIDLATHLASIAIEREREEAERAHILKQERAARERAEHLAAEITAIVRQVAEGIIVTDAKGRITFFNEAAKRIYGMETSSDRGETRSYELLAPAGEPYPLVDRPLWRAAMNGETVIDAEWRIRRADGAEIIAQGSATPIVFEQGRRVGAVLTVRDVTAQRTIEREKDEFLAAASHDLKGPLTVIKGTAELLEQRAKTSHWTGGTAWLVAGLSRIVNASNTSVDLINEFLDIGRLRLGRPLELQCTPTDLVALARQTVSDYQVSTERHSIQLQATIPFLVGMWDQARLLRVLGNLLSNSVKFSPSGGEISVEIEQEKRKAQNWAVMRVRDHGVGIPASEIGQIFQRYHRAGNVQGRIKGSGIGLASAKFIVEQHGGTIHAESVEGVGTTMTVRLPLQPSDG